MGVISLTEAQRLKFEVLASGISVDDDCATVLATKNHQRPLTPADYASTSGLILRLDDEVWVNAPVSNYNPNFVANPAFTLSLRGGSFQLAGEGLSSSASIWIPPEYHGHQMQGGRPWNNFVVTHGDRARLAPIGGCAMACKFCNIPYEDPYETKPLDRLVEATRRALNDPVQPARHLLISGGTPRANDVPYLRDVYRRILTEFPGIEVDVMMAPVDGLFDLEELRDLGLHDLSINLEVYDEVSARTLMPHKYRQGLDHYLGFLERASHTIGPGRVRSMLMVGLEPAPSTLSGVQAIVNAGAVPVLSPFRPDPSTPLKDQPPLPADAMQQIFLDALAIAKKAGTNLGPECAPCTHNTLALVEPAAGANRDSLPSVALLA